MSILALINPSSGGARTLKSLDTIKSWTHNKGGDWIISESEAHFRKIIRELPASVTILGVAGGDSSIRIAAHELYANQKKQSLGVLPLGSADDIARHLGIINLRQAFQAIDKDPVPAGLCQIKAGEQQTSYLGAASFGLGSLVNQVVLKMKQKNRLWQKWQFLAGAIAIHKVLKSKDLPMALKVNDGSLAESSNLLISQIRYWSSGRPFTPEARLDEEELHSSVMKPTSFSTLAKLLLKTEEKSYASSSLLERFKEKKFLIEFEVKQSVQLDGDVWRDPKNGEIIMAKKFELWKQPRALKIHSL